MHSLSLYNLLITVMCQSVFCPQEGAGCIKVIPSLHTSLLETFRVHMTAFPAATKAANTAKPKADPKGKLLQALKLPLTMVPKAADEAEVEKVDIQLGQTSSQHPTSVSDSSGTASLSPKPYTPRLLQRLAILQRRSSTIEDDKRSTSVSPQPSPQHSEHGTPILSRPLPSPPTPTLPGSSGSPGSSQDSTSARHSVMISDQETPQMSPRLSPLTSIASGHPSFTFTTSPATSPSVDTAGAGGPSSPMSVTGMEKSGGGESIGKSSTGKDETTVAKSGGTVIKVEDAEEPPPPPSPKTEYITVWQLLVRKKYLMKHMRSDFELPIEEELIDRFAIIDFYARRIFPSLFFILFTIYWVLFNYYITDEFPSEGKEPSDGLVN